MTIWDRLRGRRAPLAQAPSVPVSEQRVALCADIFSQVLAVARQIHATTGTDRSDPLFDRHLGAVLAERCLDAQQTPEALRMMTAVLLSHCGYDAALMFVLQLTDEGRHFGVTVAPDITIHCEPPTDRQCGTADVFALAADCAKRADVAREAGPFRGPAQVLWDAGYSGLSRSSPSVEGAAADLARRVAQTWDLQPPPEASASSHAIGIAMRSNGPGS